VTVYYCWKCGHQVGKHAPREKHYETGNTIYFCSEPCLRDYRELAEL
jgi:YHS domain-containing protein